MTIHHALLSQARQPLMCICFLLLSLQMVLFFATLWDRRQKSIQLRYLLYFIFTFSLFYMCMLDICWYTYHVNSLHSIPAFLVFFQGIPLPVIFFFEIVITFLLFPAFLSLFQYRKTHPTFSSIKETMDLIPMGIAFGKPDGTIIFSNLVMNHLFMAMYGKSLMNLSAFLNAANEKQKKETQITLPGGSVWQIRSSALIIEGESLTQLVATDITEEIGFTQRLEEKNKKLQNMNLRLEIYNRQAGQIIIAQELLTARMTVHSEVGNALLESRHFLTNPESFDEEKLLLSLKHLNTYLLREYEQDDTGRDILADSIDMSETIGVSVEITGVIPAADPFRRILAAAVMECASNTVKHANGTHLTVEIQNNAADITYCLRNNGTIPAGTIHESGGLLSLRSLVEKENGTMQVKSSPEFALILCLPRE